MDWSLTLSAVQTVAIVAGVVLGLDQLRQIRRQQHIQAGAELLRPLQTPRITEAIMQVHKLPDGLSETELRARLGADFDQVLAMLGMFESLGPLVARGHVPIDMYAEFYRGPTIIAWRKLRRYIEDERARNWTTLFEWLQWLAERLEERSTDVPAPSLPRPDPETLRE